MQWLERLYSRRIFNVNVNIVMAGLLALAPLTVLIHVLTVYGGLRDKRAITGVTFVADVIFDVLIYYSLHWLANHSPRFRRHKPVHALHDSFFKDASLVQFERMTLAPVLYGFALGLQHLLMHKGWTPTGATIIGFISGIAAARILHSIWLLRQERKSLAAYHAAMTPHTPDIDPSTTNTNAVPRPAEPAAPAQVRSAS
jgi:hypothetical protein